MTRIELRVRRPSWWEIKWKPKKPTLYILEFLGDKWINTYWYGGIWNYRGQIKFYNSGEALVTTSPAYECKVVGRSGTILNIGPTKVKSLHPRKSEWTCFGEFNLLGEFIPKVSKFDFHKEIRKSY